MKEISTDRAPQAIGPYSQAIDAGDKIFTSGVIPVDPATGETVGETAQEQARQVFTNLKALLSDAGSGIDKVIKTVVFIKNMDDFAKINEVYAEFFSKPYPARSCVEVARLPKDVLIEVEAIAEK
ncbi:MAG: RidA family protein [Lachnospiraceae bacterium]|nr:RidA family protein [Lachnospiraceae bacterium]MCR5410852.1 RidA family protein [Lachnospiraceae bacterium]